MITYEFQHQKRTCTVSLNALVITIGLVAAGRLWYSFIDIARSYVVTFAVVLLLPLRGPTKDSTKFKTFLIIMHISHDLHINKFI